MNPTDFPFPTEPSINSGNWKHNFRKVHGIYQPTENLGFELALRCDLVHEGSTDPRTSPGGFQELARFDDADGQLCLILSRVTLSHEVNPADWLYIDLEASGAQVLHQQNHFTHQGLLPDVLSCIQRSSVLVRRSRVLKAGPHLVRLDAVMKEATYKENALDILLILASFRLVGNGTTTAERLRKCTLGAPSLLTFRCPWSWQLRLDLDADDTWQAILEQPADSGCVARIKVLARRVTQPVPCGTLMEHHIAALRSEGIGVKGGPVLPQQPVAGWESIHRFQAPAQCESQSLDLVAFVFQQPGLTVLTGLLGPDRRVSPEWWAIGKRAFEIVCHSLEPTP